MFTPCCDKHAKSHDREGDHTWTCPHCKTVYRVNTSKWVKLADNQGEIKSRTHRYHKVMEPVK